MPTHTQTLNVTNPIFSGALITIAQSIASGAGIGATFNTTATEIINSGAGFSAGFSLITIGKTIDQTETGFTTDFNTEFVGQIVFNLEIPPQEEGRIRILDLTTNPLVFHDRDNGEPIIFLERCGQGENKVTLPIVFHSISGLQAQINREVKNLSASFNYDSHTQEIGIGSGKSLDWFFVLKSVQSEGSGAGSFATSFSTSVA